MKFHTRICIATSILAILSPALRMMAQDAKDKPATVSTDAQTAELTQLRATVEQLKSAGNQLQTELQKAQVTIDALATSANNKDAQMKNLQQALPQICVSAEEKGNPGMVADPTTFKLSNKPAQKTPEDHPDPSVSKK